MLIVPVIDIKGGVAVRAVAGERAAYRPIETPFAPGTSDPVAVVRGLAAAFPQARTVYVADLDGITAGNPDRDMMERLVAAMPGLTLLVDDGCSSPDDVKQRGCRLGLLPVIGSETLACGDALAEIVASAVDGCALSLDMKGTDRLGPDVVFERPEHWPQTVIVMSLDRVGTGFGPDLERLAVVKSQAGAARRVLAAGGVRDANDLAAIAALGCGALVASGLHDGRVTRGDFDRLFLDES